MIIQNKQDWAERGRFRVGRIRSIVRGNTAVANYIATTEAYETPQKLSRQQAAEREASLENDAKGTP